MRTIRQKNPGDCAVCALAMYLGLSYLEMILAFGYVCDKIAKIQGGGLNTDDMRIIIRAYTGEAPLVVTSRIDPFHDRRDDMMALIQGKKAILCAPSLNVEGVGHAVYWNGSKVFDPSKKKRFTKKTINPYEIIF